MCAYWIEAGHKKAGLPLLVEDLFDATLNQADITYQLQLQPGDMIFQNNQPSESRMTSLKTFGRT